MRALPPSVDFLAFILRPAEPWMWLQLSFPVLVAMKKNKAAQNGRCCDERYKLCKYLKYNFKKKLYEIKVKRMMGYLNLTVK